MAEDHEKMLDSLMSTLKNMRRRMADEFQNPRI
jgi:hypothetical protein